MIVYRGIDLQDVAPVDIADIVVGTVKRNAVTNDRPTRPGVEFVRITDNIRTVSITIADLTNDMETRLSEIDAINAWAAGDEPGRLVLPFRGGKYLNAVCTQYIEPSYRQWWETKLKLTFTAYDPYFCDPAEKRLDADLGGVTVKISGSAEPLMRITQYPEVTVSSLYWTVNGKTVTITGTFEAGQYTLDLNKQTITNGSGNSLSDKVTLASRFPEFSKSMSVVTGLDSTIFWRERYA